MNWHSAVSHLNWRVTLQNSLRYIDPDGLDTEKPTLDKSRAGALGDGGPANGDGPWVAAKNRQETIKAQSEAAGRTLMAGGAAMGNQEHPSVGQRVLGFMADVVIGAIKAEARGLLDASPIASEWGDPSAAGDSPDMLPVRPGAGTFGLGGVGNVAGGSDLASMSGTLRDAARGKGNFGLGSATRAEADALGKAWVGDGYRVAKDGATLVSKDRLRQYRPPSFKPNLGRTQANFERHIVDADGGFSKQWQGNGHLDILD